MKSAVRVAVPSDAEAMMTLLREMHQENGLAALDEDLVRSVLTRGLARDRAIVGIIRGDRGIEASIGLYVGKWWYSSEEHVEDLWSFVSEKHRKSEHAKTLLQWAKHSSAELGRPLMMGVLTSTRTEAKVRLYERQLGRAVGALFVVPVAAEVAA